MDLVKESSHGQNKLVCNHEPDEDDGQDKETAEKVCGDFRHRRAFSFEV
jgi:hypothetical protein